MRKHYIDNLIMPLLFLLAGTNTSYSIQKRGTTTYSTLFQ